MFLPAGESQINTQHEASPAHALKIGDIALDQIVQIQRSNTSRIGFVTRIPDQNRHARSVAAIEIRNLDPELGRTVVSTHEMESGSAIVSEVHPSVVHRVQVDRLMALAFELEMTERTKQSPIL